MANATATKPRPGALRTVAVIRGSLTEILPVDGTVAAQAQEPILYPWRGLVDDVKVKTGQSVSRGDILIEFSQGEIPRNLDTARAHLQTSLGNLALAHTQSQASQTSTAQRVAADLQKQSQAVLDAQLALSRAEDNLVRVKAGKSPTEKQVADTAVTDYGTTQLATAQHALDVAMAGPDDNTIRLAQRDLANAKTTLSKVQSDYAILTGGPDPAAMRAAQSAVQRAQAQLQIAQVAKLDPKAADPAVAKLQHDTAIQDAQTVLDNANAQVDKLNQPPSAIDVQTAQYRVLDAQTNLQAAQDKLDTLQAGPDQAAIDAAQHQVEATKHALAEVKAIRDEVYSHPTPAELQAAQDQVRSAQAALDNARQAAPVADATGPDLTALQKVIDQDQADVASAEQALENTHLRAPFDGVIVAVRTKPGDATVPSRPVVIMAKPGPPIVRVDLDDDQAALVANGQQASVQIGTDAASQRVDATVTSTTAASDDGTVGPSANLEVKWVGGKAPTLGMPVQVTVNLGAKDGVLVVPKSAVHKLGTRTTVEVQDGATRRLVDVQVGITTADSAEIVSGLTEGQMVLAGPA